ncbi:hypothetical protein JN080_27420 [Bacillus sp. EB600]|nr:hypothetical protein [Bacillus sp. EB600]
MIRNNRDKYSISAMFKVLHLPRATYYYEVKERVLEDEITSDIMKIFQASRLYNGYHSDIRGFSHFIFPYKGASTN